MHEAAKPLQKMSSIKQFSLFFFHFDFPVQFSDTFYAVHLDHLFMNSRMHARTRA